MFSQHRLRSTYTSRQLKIGFHGPLAFNRRNTDSSHNTAETNSSEVAETQRQVFSQCSFADSCHRLDDFHGSLSKVKRVWAMSQKNWFWISPTAEDINFKRPDHLENWTHTHTHIYKNENSLGVKVFCYRPAS